MIVLPGEKIIKLVSRKQIHVSFFFYVKAKLIAGIFWSHVVGLFMTAELRISH